MRHSQLVESHVRAILVSKKVTDEGEIIPYHPTELKVGVDIEGEVDNILFLWPATVIHKIDEESPFYHLNAQVKRSGVNFINEFTRSFYAHRSRKCKKLLDMTAFFALLGSARVKSAPNMLVKRSV